MKFHIFSQQKDKPNSCALDSFKKIQKEMNEKHFRILFIQMESKVKNLRKKIIKEFMDNGNAKN